MTAGATTQAIVDTALAATGAAAAWIVVPTADGNLEVVAASGELAGIAGETVPTEGTFAGFVIASAQPIAMQPRAGDERLDAVRSRLGRDPASVVSVPCSGDDEINGALELIDKRSGGAFDFDDVETATILARVAGAAIDERGSAQRAASPEELGGALRRLADADPARYERVAALITTVLSAQ